MKPGVTAYINAFTIGMLDAYPSVEVCVRRADARLGESYEFLCRVFDKNHKRVYAQDLSVDVEEMCYYAAGPVALAEYHVERMSRHFFKVCSDQ